MLKRYWPLIFVVIVPYLGFLILADMNSRLVLPGVLLLELLRITGLAIGGFTALACIMKEWDAREALLVNMAAKLIQIPVYILNAAYGGASLLLLYTAINTVSAIISGLFAIATTGLIGAAGVIRAKNEGYIDGSTALILGALQFVFVADVIAAIVAFAKTKRG